MPASKCETLFFHNH